MSEPAWRTLAVFSELLIATSLGLTAHLAQRLPTRLPFGPRGIERARALHAHVWLRLLEPGLRFAAALCAPLLSTGTRATLELLLRRAGEPWGTDADELVAISTGALVLGALAGARGVPLLLEAHGLVGAVAGGLAGALPLLRVHGIGLRRQRSLDRALPGAIDLIALCIGAGLDFNGALELWIAHTGDRKSPLCDELTRLARGLAMGRTRAELLRELTHAVPTDAVTDFVNAIVQAEQKGTPLAVVIETQAQMLRLRRSVAAEQAAARAAVLLLLPLLLLLAAILLVLFSPFVINGTGL